MIGKLMISRAKWFFLLIFLSGIHIPTFSMDEREQPKWRSKALVLEENKLNKRGYYQLNSNKFGGVDLEFTALRGKPDLNDFQMLEVLWKDLKFLPPNPQRLSSSQWQRLHRSYGENNKFNVTITLPHQEYQSVYYEVWGCETRFERCDGGKEFLGYVDIRKPLDSLEEFIQRYQYDYIRNNDFNSLNKVLQEDAGSWRTIKLKLGDSPNPHQYRLESFLGLGTDGYVFKALPVDQGDPVVALKCFIPGFGDVINLKINSEIEARSFFPRRYTVQLLSSEKQEIAGMKALVMEYVDHAVTLDAFLQKQPAISPETARKILEAIETFYRIQLQTLTGDNVLLVFDDFQAPTPTLLKDIKFIDFSKIEFNTSIRKDPRLMGAMESNIEKLIESITSCIENLDQRKSIQEEYSKKIKDIFK